MDPFVSARHFLFWGAYPGFWLHLLRLDTSSSDRTPILRATMTENEGLHEPDVRHRQCLSGKCRSPQTTTESSPDYPLVHSCSSTLRYHHIRLIWYIISQFAAGHQGLTPGLTLCTRKRCPWFTLQRPNVLPHRHVVTDALRSYIVTQLHSIA